MKNILMKIAPVFIVTLIGSVILGVSTYAAGYIPLEPSVSGNEVSGNMGEYLNRIYKLGIAITGILAVLFIVIGGFQYMLSESVFDKGAGRDKITAALGGLILALASWMILNTINPDLIKFNLKLPDIKQIEVVAPTPIPTYEICWLKRLDDEGKITKCFPVSLSTGVTCADTNALSSKTSISSKAECDTFNK